MAALAVILAVAVLSSCGPPSAASTAPPTTGSAPATAPATTTSTAPRGLATGSTDYAYYAAAKAILEKAQSDSKAMFTGKTSKEIGEGMLTFRASVTEALTKWRALNPPARFKASHELGLKALEAYDSGLTLFRDATFNRDAVGKQKAQDLLTRGYDYYGQWLAELTKEAG